MKDQIKKPAAKRKATGLIICFAFLAVFIVAAIGYKSHLFYKLKNPRQMGG